MMQEFSADRYWQWFSRIFQAITPSTDHTASGHCTASFMSLINQRAQAQMNLVCTCPHSLWQEKEKLQGNDLLFK